MPNLGNPKYENFITGPAFSGHLIFHDVPCRPNTRFGLWQAELPTLAESASGIGWPIDEHVSSPATAPLSSMNRYSVDYYFVEHQNDA